MINGVLVERTVKDVIPALKTNSDGLKMVLEDLVKQYNNKQMEMEKWKVRLKSNIHNRIDCVLTCTTLEEEQYPGCTTIAMGMSGAHTGRSIGSRKVIESGSFGVSLTHTYGGQSKD